MQSERLLAGLSVRSKLTDCPLGAFEVKITRCGGRGDCASVCPVNVIETDQAGRCTVAEDALCFGCMACLAQCLDDGVKVLPKETSQHLTVEYLLR